MTVDAPQLSETYDVLMLLENAMDDCELAEELLEQFHSRLVYVRESLETSLQEGDLNRATSIAHSLKGESGILGASQVHHVAEQLELSLKAPGNPEVTPLVAALRNAVDRCLKARPEALSAIRDSQPSEQ